MFNKLFLVNGLDGTINTDFIDFIQGNHRSTSTIVHKYTTRILRNAEESNKTDLMIISEEEFQNKFNNDFYCYSYGDKWYGFSKNDVMDALTKFENVFIIIRNSNLIAKLTIVFSEIALVIPIYIYTNRDFIDRLRSKGLSQEDINYCLQSLEGSWNNYLEYPDGNIRIIINNYDKSNFYHKINLLIGEFSMDRIDLPNYIYINPQLKFELIKPLIGFKQDINERLNRFPYEKNIFLMMKFRPSNEDFYDFIKTEIENAGFNCVRADADEWNITNNVYNPLAVLYCCKFGIALFDQPEKGQNYNPNVAYELGIMHYQGKNVLLLTYEDLPQIPFDLIKDLRKNYKKEIDFRRLFTRWLREISLS